ncbi:addiction module antidote protein, HigA family [Adhaeribacter arboris]|uniref:Addiction module antidote protein, HigA family n=1 Tax=Adhaeribacter arboris TaxID=2072846 RepID=A0A2T2Y8Q1_9BACT|nr:HigA family addiction module antitoxin [Adhaeribacter arboris]PSR51884.1 addiction module antidote protein, HigA family [Adhaeribacter arboris]
MRYKTIEDIEAAEFLISPPGETLSETMEAKGINQPELALRMGRPLKTINEILKGKASITPETALQLERVLGVPAAFWLERERNYQLELAEIREAREMLEVKDWVLQFPLKEMKELGWISFTDGVVDKVNSILTFFSVSDKKAFDNYYHQSTYATAFRLSAAKKKNPYAVAAWLRQGELQAAEIKAPCYDTKSFRNALETIKELMANEQDTFFNQLQNICLKAGVKVVHTPCLPNSPACGSTRWINDSPLVQLSNRYKRNDIFWFTFFHEAGHILLHGKKDVFIEGLEYTDEGLEKEKEADEFSKKWTLTPKQEQEIMAEFPLTVEKIKAFARKYTTLPALIIGRLANQGLLHHSEGWTHGLFRKISFE